jgi:hypothetical protein
MSPKESSLPSQESKKIAFFAFACFKYTSEELQEKFGDKYTPYEAIFALTAYLADVAINAGMPLDQIQINIEAMYKTKCTHDQEAANDTTH